jgi:hypothetical protein
MRMTPECFERPYLYPADGEDKAESCHHHSKAMAVHPGHAPFLFQSSWGRVQEWKWHYGNIVSPFKLRLAQLKMASDAMVPSLRMCFIWWRRDIIAQLVTWQLELLTFWSPAICSWQSSKPRLFAGSCLWGSTVEGLVDSIHDKVNVLFLDFFELKHRSVHLWKVVMVGDAIFLEDVNTYVYILDYRISFSNLGR